MSCRSLLATYLSADFPSDRTAVLLALRPLRGEFMRLLQSSVPVVGDPLILATLGGVCFSPFRSRRGSSPHPLRRRSLGPLRCHWQARPVLPRPPSPPGRAGRDIQRLSVMGDGHAREGFACRTGQNLIPRRDNGRDGFLRGQRLSRNTDGQTHGSFGDLRRLASGDVDKIPARPGMELGERTDPRGGRWPRQHCLGYCRARRRRAGKSR